MEFNYIEILTLLLGSGFILSIITLVYNWQQSKIQNKIQDRRESNANNIQDRREVAARDFEARKIAQAYYMGLYSHIAILDELIRGYHGSIQDGKAQIFDFKECKYVELQSRQILENYKEAYLTFSGFYIKKKCEGYEIFVSDELRKLLIDFWYDAKTFYEDSEQMRNKEAIDEFHAIAEKTTNCMEKLFGLDKQGR